MQNRSNNLYKHL